MRRMASRNTLRLLFLGVAVFVLLQLVWWIVFQRGYTEDVTARTVQGWERDSLAAGTLLAGGIPPAELATLYPYLRLDVDRYVVDDGALADFRREQNRFLRMFINESLGFALVLLLGFWLINRRLVVEEQLKLQQQNFLSAVTHELKTPMSSLRLLIETAQLRELPPQRLQDYLARMEGELSRLERSSEMVLASARLEQGTQEVKLSVHDLNVIAGSYVERGQNGFDTRAAQVTFTGADAPQWVAVDPDALELVMSNLVDNAIKYTPDAPRKVHVSIAPDDHVVRLHVDDEGKGIPPGDAQKVFDRFYRIGSEMVRSAPGVGLGLHLVRSTVEAMNGWVRCEPNPVAGRGTRFTVLLPLKAPSDGKETEN